MLDILKIVATSGIFQATVIALITAFIARILTPKGRLIWAVSHRHHYRMPNLDGGTFPVITQQVWFQNSGRSSIDDIEIVLNWKPQHFEIWNPRPWDQGVVPDGRFFIKIPSLYAKEHFTLSMIDTINELPAVITVRWKGDGGKFVPMSPQRIYPTWMTVPMLIVTFIGAVSIIYVLLQIFISALPFTVATPSNMPAAPPVHTDH